MEQLAPIVAVCRLAILKRMLTTPLTLLVAHLLREQVKVQEESSPETDFLADPRAETSKYG